MMHETLRCCFYIHASKIPPLILKQREPVHRVWESCTTEVINCARKIVMTVSSHSNVIPGNVYSKTPRVRIYSF